MKAMIVLSMIVMLSAVGPGADRPVFAENAGTPDSRLGLSKGSVFDVPTPPAVQQNTTTPGERPVLPRAYVIAPPRIPHGIADLLPITAKQNECLGCHDTKEPKKVGEPTPIPPTHYTDYRNAPDQVGPAVVGSRYVCVSCHVPTTDAHDLVQNTFRR